MPLEVLKKAQEEMLCYPGAGCSDMEMSHRSDAFDSIIDGAEECLRDIMKIPDDYAVLFMQGGATTQFSMVAMNLAKQGDTMCYIQTGQFSTKAKEEGDRWGNAVYVASSKDGNYSYIPEVTKLPEDAKFLHMTGNNTIYGTTFYKVPEHGDIPLAADWSSAILGRWIDVKDYDLTSLRNAVSVVLQKNILFSGTILDNLRWGNPKATEEQCIRACQLAQADEFIQQMSEGYNTHIEQGGTNVSGGQKQRLCIARALLKQPKVLVLDDSTSACDTATDAKIQRAFREDLSGMTKIIIAQRILSVKDCDRILVMDNGIVTGFDTHENLLKDNALYQEINAIQSADQGDFDATDEHQAKGGDA